ncbi:MAG TPA: iron uptake system protein EfeO [Actinomycetes bacterium]|nr:iron uptake system protein EfeO [Actinomycetes bacterium]
MTALGRASALALGVLMIGSLAACSQDPDEAAAAGTEVSVHATDTACELGAEEIEAGSATFAIHNEGSKVTEVYVLRSDESIVAERENIGPGTSADLTVALRAGDYVVRCKPGMAGEGIAAPLAVTGGPASAAPAADARLEQAVTDYRAYVLAQVDDSIKLTEALVAAVKAGNVAEAKRLYAPSRVGWESIEPVAESFGDIDPRVDLREADLAAGEEWTGWHRIEKGLFVSGSTDGLASYGDQLLADLRELRQRVPDAEITPTSMANGAKELLDEVATGKVTGEEEAFSHTDLVDFEANVVGAEKVLVLLHEVVTDNEPELAATLDKEFGVVLGLLDKHRDGDGFVSYDTVGDDDRRVLSDAVNALAEPLSNLAAAVTPR